MLNGSDGLYNCTVIDSLPRDLPRSLGKAWNVLILLISTLYDTVDRIHQEASATSLMGRSLERARGALISFRYYPLSSKNTLHRGSIAPELHHFRPLMTYEPRTWRMEQAMFVASELATIGSVMRNALRISPGIMGTGFGRSSGHH